MIGPGMIFLYGTILGFLTGLLFTVRAYMKDDIEKDKVYWEIHYKNENQFDQLLIKAETAIEAADVFLNDKKHVEATIIEVKTAEWSKRS